MNYFNTTLNERIFKTCNVSSNCSTTSIAWGKLRTQFHVKIGQLKPENTKLKYAWTCGNKNCSNVDHVYMYDSTADLDEFIELYKNNSLSHIPEFIEKRIKSKIKQEQEATKTKPFQGPKMAPASRRHFYCTECDVFINEPNIGKHEKICSNTLVNAHKFIKSLIDLSKERALTIKKLENQLSTQKSTPQNKEKTELDFIKEQLTSLGL